jgi:hypothetical protein
MGEVAADTHEEEIDQRLMGWGFGEEVRAVRHDLEIAQSEAFQAGYQWAIRQDPNYLLMHFGVYFDEWNEKGLRKMSEDQRQELHKKAEAVGVSGEAPEALSLDEAMVSGVLTAVKEIKLRDLLETRKCEMQPQISG